MIALELLDDAAAAADRLAVKHDEKALHDFRVALRRLRSWLRAFKRDLKGSVHRKDRRRLQRVAAATNLGRETDVQIAWLVQASKGRSAKRTRGAAWLTEYLEAERRLAGEPQEAAYLEEFADVRAQLADRIPPAKQRARGRSARKPLARAIVAELEPHVDALGVALRAARSFDDAAAAHRARIAAKRLRYLIEPAVKHVKAGGAVLDRLKKLQDDLGELHDAHLMANRLQEALDASAEGDTRARDHDATSLDNGSVTLAPRDGLLAIAKKLRADTHSLFDRVHAEWQDGDGAFTKFTRQMRTFEKRLEKAGR
jgi:CHAD domain-containing protein